MKRIPAVTALVLLLTVMLSGCGLLVKKPAIREESFTFTVVYEVNGETVTLSDELVCEYAGTEWHLDGGSSRAWREGFKAGALDGLLPILSTEDGGAIVLVINAWGGYFLGDPTYADTPPDVHIRIDYNDEEGFRSVYDAEEIASHGVRLVSFTCDGPIENRFGLLQ